MSRMRLIRWMMATTSSTNRIAAASPDRVAALRADVARELDEGPGLRMRVIGDGADRLRGSVRGPGIQRTTVKTLDVGCAGVSWGGDASIAFDLAPDERCDLLVLSTRPDRLVVELEVGERATSEGIDVGALNGPRRIELTDDGWVSSDGAPTDAGAGLALWRQGAPGSDDAEDHGAIDPMLEE